MRHSVIEQAGPQLDIRISQDLEYWGYIATFGSWGYIPKPLWVGNSHFAARAQGWLRRYRKRRKLCPEVEQWETRIWTRLSPTQRASFELVRGRVALGYAHNKILSGARKSAYQVVKKYGSTMPSCPMSRLMCSAIRFGRVGWFAACTIICLKEWMKACRVKLGW
jgi:hypothetical protein